jgi:TonB family protein
MRSILVASLLLVPSLFPAAANASQPASDSSTSTPAIRVSTGVVAPKILSSTYISIPPSPLDQTVPSEATLVLSLNVDEQGKAQDVQVVKSDYKQLDNRVAEAVRHLRFSPAKLDDQAVATDLNLTVVVQH